MAMTHETTVLSDADKRRYSPSIIRCTCGAPATHTYDGCVYRCATCAWILPPFTTKNTRFPGRASTTTDRYVVVAPGFDGGFVASNASTKRQALALARTLAHADPHAKVWVMDPRLEYVHATVQYSL